RQRAARSNGESGRVPRNGASAHHGGIKQVRMDGLDSRVERPESRRDQFVGRHRGPVGIEEGQRVLKGLFLLPISLVALCGVVENTVSDILQGRIREARMKKESCRERESDAKRRENDVKWKKSWRCEIRAKKKAAACSTDTHLAQID